MAVLRTRFVWLFGLPVAPLVGARAIRVSRQICGAQVKEAVNSKSAHLARETESRETVATDLVSPLDKFHAKRNQTTSAQPDPVRFLGGGFGGGGNAGVGVCPIGWGGWLRESAPFVKAGVSLTFCLRPRK